MIAMKDFGVGNEGDEAGVVTQQTGRKLMMTL